MTKKTTDSWIRDFIERRPPFESPWKDGKAKEATIVMHDKNGKAHTAKGTITVTHLDEPPPTGVYKGNVWDEAMATSLLDEMQKGPIPTVEVPPLPKPK